MKILDCDGDICAVLSDRGLESTLESSGFGVSKTPFDRLNIAYHVGDNPQDVAQNRALILQKYFADSKDSGIIESSLQDLKKDSKKLQNLDSKDSKNLVNLDSKNNKNKKTLLYLRQIHSNHIIAIRQNEARFYTPNLIKTQSIESFKSEKTQDLNEINLGEFDGLICDNPAFVGLIMVADCNAILLYNSNKKVFALLHAGRLGVQKKILSNAIKILQDDFGVNARDLKAFISPSIRQCCYEIGDLKSEFEPRYIRDNRLDMIAMLRDEMQENGMLESNIDISPICTCCDTRYFSHRRASLQNEKSTGRFGIFASVRI
ncbi:hypothetical protein DCO58_00950 [Helicobacter saguini]|uniref:Laccase domain-containing protein n=1 Tax=Helicobacter saguini TaxID=1548018 RepID=A0A347VZR9_9HELI|nr:polyphenol oxidase family protein [Helicobacter saguini]MWV63043.1 hypothetical protein [Helicobacter saguini]MWV66288.1 hypothetical protein [Helicobacter saguini]MWV68640.1 hypothetical protein [Helicobacter saguini]MWV71809.1 hypothetical protein [Helicobacter saguini]TLD95835.1 laccase domain-containing protein [Helicobacter saguini]